MKIAVTLDREIAITLNKQEAATLKDELDDARFAMGVSYLVPNASPFKQLHEKLVDALYQAMRETDAIGPVE